MSTLESHPAPLPEGSPETYESPVCVRKSKYGRGVFARRKIMKGELFDFAPIVRSLWPEIEHPEIEETMISDYIYAWIHSSRETAENTPSEELSMPEYVGSAQGFGSYYNHSFEPNAIYVRRKNLDFLDYIALRDIEPDEEILINYNGDPADKSELWFPVF